MGAEPKLSALTQASSLLSMTYSWLHPSRTLHEPPWSVQEAGSDCLWGAQEGVGAGMGWVRGMSSALHGACSWRKQSFANPITFPPPSLESRLVLHKLWVPRNFLWDRGRLSSLNFCGDRVFIMFGSCQMHCSKDTPFLFSTSQSIEWASVTLIPWLMSSCSCVSHPITGHRYRGGGLQAPC